MISPPRNRVGTVADDVSRSDLPRADSGAVLREHELRVVRCRYPLCPRRVCHPKDASAFGPPIRRISPGKVPLRNGRRTQGARPSKTNNEPRALLAARGYWSLGNFLRRSLVRGVGVSPSASCGCRTRISARGREAPSSVQALHNTGDLTCPAGGQKCALHFLGLAHVCGPQPGGLDRDSRRRPMPLIILGRRRLRLDMTTQGVASRVTTTIRVGDGTLRQ